MREALGMPLMAAMRTGRVVLAVVSLLALVACATQTSAVGRASPRGGATAASPQTAATPDPPTRAALLRIAQRFNDNYDNGKFGAVWGRWDRRSRALIARAEYIRRHEVCAPASGAVAKVEGAEPSGTGAWHVHYEIDGVQLVDTWYYRHGRWVFDIIRSNPKAAKQYAMPFGTYAAAVGCSVH